MVELRLRLTCQRTLVRRERLEDLEAREEVEESRADRLEKAAMAHLQVTSGQVVSVQVSKQIRCMASAELIFCNHLMASGPPDHLLTTS